MKIQLIIVFLMKNKKHLNNINEAIHFLEFLMNSNIKLNTHTCMLHITNTPF